jgi:ATP-dependent helicase HrpB
MRPSGLPIDAALPALRQALLEQRAAVLQAPPGAGKSTVVPLALLEEPWAAGRRIVLLEPRRLAARAVAQRMASTLGEAVGATVGYRMRLDTRVSRGTRIEVVTEGVLTRMLQSDPALEGTAALIFDEFHERSLQADLGLALALDAQAHLTPELRLLVMSATVDAPAIARFLEDAPLVVLAGRSFAVESHFLGRGPPILPGPGPGPAGSAPESVERLIARLVRRALEEQTGDVLVFLPGGAEIRRVQSLLADTEDRSLRVMPLFGELGAAEQDAALAPSSGGMRKVVLATNIAETSLTIEGIRTVVDAGLVRRSEFDPVTGMSRLVTRRISRASADQRQGRAGRLGPGVCYRAWSEGAHDGLAPFAPPEILEADLMPLALDLAAWGVREATTLRWLEAPPPASLAAARELLERLGALSPGGAISAHGRAMASLGVHPRLAHMLLKARELDGGSLEMAAQLAALLSERDLLRATGAARDVDIRSRLSVLRGELAAPVDRGALQRISRAARAYVAQLEANRAAPNARAPSQQEIDLSGILLAFAYPDRIAQRRPGSEPRYLLANGRGAYFADAHSLGREEFIVAVDLDDSAREARILLAAPLGRETLLAHCADRLRRSESIEWNEREQAVIARQVTRLDEIIVEEKPLPGVAREATAAALLEGVRRLGVSALPWTRESRELQARIEFVRAQAPTLSGPSAWPAVSDESLQESLQSWLLPWLDGLTRREHLARVPMLDALRALLSFEQLRQLDELAPTHLGVPSGSRVRIDYLDDSAPAVAVRLQEVFGLQATPRIAGGRVPVTFKLLSPAQRPVQVTRDLASFWRSTYAEVRKDLRGRYPRHYWPEDPLSAVPTRRVRPPS